MVFHVEHTLLWPNSDLFQNDESTAKRVDQRIGRLPDEAEA